MRQSDRDALLVELETLVSFVTAETPVTVSRLSEWSSGGFPGSGGQNGSSGHRGASPVESAASRPDTHAVWAKMLDRDLKTARDALRSARATILNAVPLPVVNEEAAEGCVSCKRVNVWSPVHALVRLGARPGRPRADATPGVPLCDWCGSFYRSEEKLPPSSLVERHAEGRKVTQRDVERAERSA